MKRSALALGIDCYFQRYAQCLSRFYFSRASEFLLITVQIKSFLLAYEAVKITINSQVGWRGYMGRVIGVRFLRGSMCAEGMGCERRWVRWALRGTGVF